MGQDFAELNRKPLTSASAWIYGFLVTKADDSVFTVTEIIDVQPTTSSNEDTTLSNDSSDSATESFNFFNIKSEPNLNGTVTDILIASKDNIWTSVYGSSVVICINSKTAAVTQTISLLIKYPVSLEFGGVKRDILYMSGGLRDTCKVGSNSRR
ncbi:hypothetical protein CBL_12564 [Carabus blaptoides fortunei]